LTADRGDGGGIPDRAQQRRFDEGRQPGQARVGRLHLHQRDAVGTIIPSGRALISMGRNPA
jgi:hypothetical protein